MHFCKMFKVKNSLIIFCTSRIHSVLYWENLKIIAVRLRRNILETCLSIFCRNLASLTSLVSLRISTEVKLAWNKKEISESLLCFFTHLSCRPSHFGENNAENYGEKHAFLLEKNKVFALWCAFIQGHSRSDEDLFLMLCIFFNAVWLYKCVFYTTYTYCISDHTFTKFFKVKGWVTLQNWYNFKLSKKERIIMFVPLPYFWPCK